MAAIRYPLRTPLSYALLMATLFALAVWLVLLARGVRLDVQFLHQAVQLLAGDDLVQGFLGFGLVLT